MPDTLLQTYLTNQFIKTDDDGNIAHLKKAIIEVVKRLEKKKAKIIPYTLVAMDPLISETDPVVIEVEKIIISKWSAFKNSIDRTREKPTTYVRAVVLDALRQLAKSNEDYAAMIWHTSRDISKYYDQVGEIETIYDFLQHLANQTEKGGQLLWGETQEAQLPDFSIPEIEVDSKVVSEKYLIERLRAAAGPHWHEGGSNIKSENANEHWPSQNAPWITMFGNIAGKTIAKSVNSVLSAQNKSIEALAQEINISLQGLIPFIVEIKDVIISNVQATNKQSKLLWWKQALYSPNLKKSYRSLEPVNAAIIMAVDLASMVDPIYPHSVDFLLMETLKSVHDDQIDKLEPLSHWIELASSLDENEVAMLQHLTNEGEGRKPLGTALANSLNGITSADIFTETGIIKEATLSLGDLAVWVFHDLQAAKIAQTK